MEIKTADELYDHIEALEPFFLKAVILANLKARYEDYGSVDYDDISIQDGMFVAEISHHVGCGEWEYHTIRITPDDLFDEGYEDKFLEKIRLQKEAEEEKKRVKEEREKQTKERRTYEMYLKLKAKYEGGNNEKDLVDLRR